MEIRKMKISDELEGIDKQELPSKSNFEDMRHSILTDIDNREVRTTDINREIRNKTIDYDVEV